MSWAADCFIPPPWYTSNRFSNCCDTIYKNNIHGTLHVIYFNSQMMQKLNNPSQYQQEQISLIQTMTLTHDTNQNTFVLFSEQSSKFLCLPYIRIKEFTVSSITQTLFSPLHLDQLSGPHSHLSNGYPGLFTLGQGGQVMQMTARFQLVQW